MLPNNISHKDSSTLMHMATSTYSAGLVFTNTILSIYVKSLDPDQDRYSFGPDVDPTCL